MNAERGVQLLLLAAATVVIALLFAPYLQFVLAAALLAYLLAPLQRRLAPRIGPRPSALALLALAVVAVLVPLALLVNAVVAGFRDLLAAVREGEAGLDALEAALQAVFGTDFDLPEAVREALAEFRPGSLVGDVLGVVGGVSEAVVGTVVLAFALYYLLVAGDRLVGWLRALSPLAADVEDDLLARADELAYAVLVGNLVVAVLQGVLVGGALFAVGFDDAAFWATMTALLSLLPVVGAPVVWVPASAVLLLGDRPVAAAALVLFGLVVVGLVDDALRPLVGGREARLNPGLFVVGVFGGLATLGLVGIFVGPILVGLAKTTFEVVGRDVQEA